MSVLKCNKYYINSLKG